MNTEEIIELLYTDMPKFGEDTGLKDSEGKSIFAGDILEFEYNEFYGLVTAVVYWDSKKAAFIRAGKFEGGGGFSSLNGECFSKTIVIGNIFKTPELFRISHKRALE